MFKEILISSAMLSLMLTISGADPADEQSTEIPVNSPAEGVAFKSSLGIRYHFPYFEHQKYVDTAMIDEFAPPMKKLVSYLDRMVNEGLKGDSETKTFESVTQIETVYQIKKLVKKHEEKLGSFMKMLNDFVRSILEKVEKDENRWKYASHEKHTTNNRRDYLRSELHRNFVGFEELAASSPVSLIFDWHHGTIFDIGAKDYYVDLLGKLRYLRRGGRSIYSQLVKFMLIILGVTPGIFG